MTKEACIAENAVCAGDSLLPVNIVADRDRVSQKYYREL
jgi:hypothetical protein